MFAQIFSQANCASWACHRHRCAFCLPTNDQRPSVEPIVEELGRRKMTNILVEGGSAVLGAFLDAGAIDEVQVFVASMMIGGREALSAMGGRGRERIADAFRLAQWKVEMMETDLYIHGWTPGRE